MSLDSLFHENDRIELHVTLDWSKDRITFDWFPFPSDKKIAHGAVWVDGVLRWRITGEGGTDNFDCPVEPRSISIALQKIARRLPVSKLDVVIFSRTLDRFSGEWQKERIGRVKEPWACVAREVLDMGVELTSPDQFQLPSIDDPELWSRAAHLLEKKARRAEKKRQEREAIRDRVRHPKMRNQERRPDSAPRTPKPSQQNASVPVSRPPLPVPEVCLEIGSATMPSPDLFATHSDLKSFLQIERASLFWVSNQSDDLLCLPYCAIEHLDYQLRTALRVTGALRGRALLSDEVGLGKTIEAGLVLKEYLTRGMVRRFLVLTVPSLIDQWAEELESKFLVPCVTTNQSLFRTNPDQFWNEENAIVASIHTLKQDSQLAKAVGRPWDMVIVDEAHYLRNRASKAWQAVNALPRQFLLLLTATPVQNSVEELYNLVTLLRPGHLPSPKEFRQRFINRDRPCEPREPEELRQLLGQVMIRNTRANTGIRIPSRRAETVLYELMPDDHGFWEEWDRELRAALTGLPAAQASLWGRFLLQAAGSSPAAWLDGLQKFPDTKLVKKWQTNAPLEQSWKRKASALPVLSQTEGGVVIFTQFLATQAALTSELAAQGVKTWVLNGQTPAPQRQGIVQSFQEEGGALLLTKSGTEGRNLQFCHRLVNFDLPWNPMEIEQRIGRLHRIGQGRIVEIYNIVQTGTLQAHLLDILQEKLNLFELIVGETGLVLGERFTGEDFEEEIFRRWRSSAGDVAGAFETLGEELSRARADLEEVKRLDETLFANDYESV